MCSWCTCWTSESLRVESCLYRDFGCVWLLSVMKFCECLCVQVFVGEVYVGVFGVVNFVECVVWWLM